MQERTFAYLISEDAGKHWRQVGLIGEGSAAKIMAAQLAEGNDNLSGQFRYRFVDVDREDEGDE